jgi:opacity protein-like surface antigen
MLFDKEGFMRDRLLAAVGLLAFAAACAGPAAAADLLSVRQPPPVQQPALPSPPYVPDWVGFYFGFHGGGAWDHASFDMPSASFFTLPGASLNGGLVGGHAGYNWQYGQIVGGVEVDFSSADLKQTSLVAQGSFGFSTRDTKIDELASARGRIGWAVLSNVLVYGTGGIGWAHTRVTFTDTFFGSTTSADETAFGWVAGAGVEYRLFEHIQLRAEYLHYDLGTVTFPSVGPLRDNINVRNSIDVVRGGISYKF